MRTIVTLAAAGWLFTASQAAMATPLYYDCDTNEGSYSELAQVQSGPTYHVRGTITPRQVRTHERYLPSGQIRLENQARTQGIAVRLVSMRRDDNFDIIIETGFRANDNMERILVGNARLNESIPFDINVSEDGSALITIGTARRILRADVGAGAKLSVICSTGEFEFGDLDLGD